LFVYRILASVTEAAPGLYVEARETEGMKRTANEKKTLLGQISDIQTKTVDERERNSSKVNVTLGILNSIELDPDMNY